MDSTADGMAKTFKLPMLPGNTCGQELLRRNFRKTQLLSGTGEKHLTRGNVPLDFGATKTVTTSPTKGEGEASIPLDRQVLRFYGYYKEAVPESALERERVRKVTLCYFLEDGTMSVSEPRQDNSGIEFQGTAVKRHLIPREDGSGNVTYDLLAVGGTVTFYGRTYFLVDCDKFTRDFYTECGVKVPEAIPYPGDSYTQARSAPQKVKEMESLCANTNAAGMKIKLSSAEVRATKQFLENDRRVLRFDTRWDDRSSLYGCFRYFTLYFFLADGTIEVVEKQQNNSGRDPFPSFVRRQKVPKPRAASSKFENINSSLTFAGKEASADRFYTDADLRIGETVVVFGRPLLIYNYDRFTQDHLTTKYNVTDHTPINVDEPQPPPIRRDPPPYNGFGSEEDSLGSWKSLESKPPRKDGTKYSKYGDSVVKFSLKLENGVATDEVRQFVLTAYLADDTISIFEPVQRNSGIVGGKFLQRQAVVNPTTNKPFVASDFFVGMHVILNKHPFVIQATDERSLSYMEENCGDFPASNLNKIIAKFRAMLMSTSSGLAEALHKADVESPGAVDFQKLMKIVHNLKLPICEQEVLTLLRNFDRNGDSYISFEEFISRVMPEGTAVGHDSRDWEAVYRSTVNAETENLSQKAVEEREKSNNVSATAAHAARAFLEAYNARRYLYHSELRFVTDYSVDSKIGPKEFRDCLVQRLKLCLSDAQLDAFCQKLFPKGAERVNYEELMRLMNGMSQHSHNVTQIATLA